MISTDRLIDMERDVLDALGRARTGSELARHVAARTRRYHLQEIVRYLRSVDPELANRVRVHFEEGA